MGYYTPNISGTNEKLEAAMRAEMHERQIQCPQLERTLHLAANLIEVCNSHTCGFSPGIENHYQLAFHECTFQEQKIIAMYNWYPDFPRIYTHYSITVRQVNYLHRRHGIQGRCLFQRL